MSRRRIADPNDPRHGTSAGASAHERQRVDLCGPCREARRQRDRERWIKKAAEMGTAGRVGRYTVLEKAAAEEVDGVVVDRIMSGQICEANTAERLEVIERWIAAGRPVRHLDRLTGWNVNRYRRAVRYALMGVAA